ncbi:hypothetical protein AMTRI_Chr02g214300 [Amborella trichopoda]
MFGCLSSAYFSVLFMGSPIDFFQASRGLCQGDLLSPFLFTIYAECFSLMLSRVERLRYFSRFSIANPGKILSHLQYADDTIIFCDADALHIKNIALFLEICEVTIGFKVNFHKSSLVGINCP